MIDWRNVSLLGIDVGFSATRRTTGIARYRFGAPADLHCVGSLAQYRAAVLNDGMVHDAIAIDGPLLPDATLPDATTLAPRLCERILVRAPFGSRCKAGFSHFGQGLKLRDAAAAIASEMPPYKRKLNSPVVEAFPNAFLGVMLDDVAYRAMGRIPRGRKSDVFFRRAAEDGAFTRLLAYLDWHDDRLSAQIAALAADETRAAHEYRAALVCVLTAGCALAGVGIALGDAAGGFICLPPKALWADWARD